MWPWWERWAGRRRGDREIEDEIGFHITARAADLERSGLPAAAAERQARLEFGALENYKEQCRETRPSHLLEEFTADLRFGLRMFRRNLGVSLLAVACLTVAIGANAAVLSWIEGILLRPFPAIPHEDRMVAITGTQNGAAGGVGESIGMSWPDFQDLARDCRSCEAFIVDRLMSTTLSNGERAERALGSVVSSNYFSALDVRPMLGRGFTPDEDTGRNAHPVTVISYRMWQDHFHGDANIVGRTQVLNGTPFTIVGVAPENFRGTFVGYSIQFWVPVSMQERFDAEGYKLEDRGARWIEGFVMLKPGVTRAQAQAELAGIAKRLETAYPASNRNRGIKLFPLWETPFNGAGAMGPTLAMALAVMVFVLLIACANVSNLLLAKALGRRHEMTVRVAVGARRSRLLRQLLTEGLLLSALSTAGGLLAANWGRNLLVLLLPPRSAAINLPGSLDWRVLAASVALCVLATLLFGVMPAVQASNVHVAAALKSATAAVVGGQRRGRLRSALVVAQVALSFLLLVGAGLLVKSLRSMQQEDPGFAANHLLISYVDFEGAGYDARRTDDTADRLLGRVAALPGVHSAAFARITPFEYRGYSSGRVAVAGFASSPDDLPTIDYNEVSPGYLATMGIPLRAGREFTRADDENAAAVAVVNETMAQRFWPGGNALGGQLQLNGRALRVVGIARNSKYRRVGEAPAAFFYVPIRQSIPGQVLQIQTSRAPQEIAPLLARAIHELDPNLAPGNVIPMEQQMALMMGPQRAALIIVAVFGLLAMGLAVVGLYGVTSYVVSQSTREFGLRIAIGAAPAHLRRLVLRDGLRLAGVGVTLGAVLAIAASRLLGYLLYRVSARDPMVFAAALGIMIAGALLACLLPARRAAAINPLEALRM